MTEEEFDRIWEETRIRQREHNKQPLTKEDEEFMNSPMFLRWQDGSDIGGNDEDDMPQEEFEKTLEGLSEDDANVLRVHRLLYLEWPRKEAFAKYSVSKEYYKENIKRLLEERKSK